MKLITHDTNITVTHEILIKHLESYCRFIWLLVVIMLWWSYFVLLWDKNNAIKWLINEANHGICLKCLINAVHAFFITYRNKEWHLKQCAILICTFSLRYFTWAQNNSVIWSYLILLPKASAQVIIPCWALVGNICIILSQNRLHHLAT